MVIVDVPQPGAAPSILATPLAAFASLPLHARTRFVVI